MQSTKVDSVQNKELLWSTLQESGAFAGVPGDQFQRVYAAFDRSVQEASRSMTGSLSDVNKHVIREFVQMLRTSTQTQNPMQNPIQNPTTQNQTPNQNQKKKKIEVVYRAEDLQNERASEFDRQFREKQAEMDSFLTLKKPTDVSFTDAKIADDKPIGDEMSRLIANELAARERELVQLKPEDIKRAQQWIGTDNNNNSNSHSAIKTELPSLPPPSSFKKSVSFSEEEHEMEQFEPNEKMNEFSDGENFEETDIFSKFKKIADTNAATTNAATTNAATTSSTITTDASKTIQQLYNKILELEQNVNAKHVEIMAHLNGLNGGTYGSLNP